MDDLLPMTTAIKGYPFRRIVGKPTAKRRAGSSRVLKSAEGNA